MTPKGRHQGWRQHHLASRCCGLWNTERRPLAGPAQRAVDLKHALVQVDVLPAERKYLAAAHASLDRQHESGLKAITSRGQKCSGLLGRKGDDLDVRLARWSDKRHDVSWQQTPPDGLSEGAVQDGMQVTDRGGGEARRKLVLVEPLEVLWGESTSLMRPSAGTA
jgi:hypothetical protein